MAVDEPGSSPAVGRSPAWSFFLLPLFSDGVRIRLPKIVDRYRSIAFVANGSVNGAKRALGQRTRRPIRPWRSDKLGRASVCPSQTPPSTKPPSHRTWGLGPPTSPRMQDLGVCPAAANPSGESVTCNRLPELSLMSPSGVNSGTESKDASDQLHS
jgi:hypothetical protein